MPLYHLENLSETPRGINALQVATVLYSGGKAGRASLSRDEPWEQSKRRRLILPLRPSASLHALRFCRNQDEVIETQSPQRRRGPQRSAGRVIDRSRGWSLEYFQQRLEGNLHAVVRDRDRYHDSHDEEGHGRDDLGATRKPVTEPKKGKSQGANAGQDAHDCQPVVEQGVYGWIDRQIPARRFGQLRGNRRQRNAASTTESVAGVTAQAALVATYQRDKILIHRLGDKANAVQRRPSDRQYKLSPEALSAQPALVPPFRQRQIKRKSLENRGIDPRCGHRAPLPSAPESCLSVRQSEDNLTSKLGPEWYDKQLAGERISAAPGESPCGANRCVR